MSRPSVPPIQPTDLRDIASEERVERIWGRLEQELVSVRARPARASRTMVWAVAATFAAFGGGLFAGKILWKERTGGPSPVVATNDRATVDVFAAGSQERTYALPGGGRVTLAPGSMIEMERAGGSDVRLRLLSGEASIDTAQASDQALAIVSGEATVATAPGSVVQVRQRADNLDVRVAAGSAQVSSPAGTRALRKGDQLDDVPTRTTTTSAHQPARVVPVHTARSARNDGAPVVAVAVAPGGWRELYSANKFPEALDLLKQQPGGIAGAVTSAKNAEELMAISDLARSKGGDGAAAITALRRVADDFPSSVYGSTAAYQLGKHYDAAGLPDLAKKYRDQAAQKGVLSEDALCAQMLAEHRAGNKAEAAARATEYQGKYPNGRCKDDATRILSGGDASEDSDARATDEPVPAPAPKPAP
jgi:hypothetical protein